MIKGRNTRVKRERYIPTSATRMVTGSGSEMKFNPAVLKTWQEDACDADNWKHGRVSDPYRDNYARVFGHD
jgi:hypothetical protein